jgi:hypothetical protein
MTLAVSLAFIAAIYFVGSRWYNRGVGLLAAFISATSLTMVVYSVESRMYIVLVLLGLLSFHFLKEQRWALFVAVTALMEYFHYYSVFIVLPHIIFFVHSGWSVPAFKRFVKSYAVIYLLMIPIFVYFFFQSYGIDKMWLKRPYLLSLPSSFAFHLFIPSSLPFSNFNLPLSFVEWLPMAAAAIIFSYLFLARYSLLEKGMVLSWASGILVILGLAYSPMHLPYHHRFALFVAPLLYLLLAKAVFEVYERWKVLAIAMLLFWLCVNAAVFHEHYFVSVQDEIKNAAAFMEDKCFDGVVMLHETPFSLMPVRSYLPQCLHVMQTGVSLNELRTGGGSVIDSRLINNQSYVPDYYFYAEKTPKTKKNCSREEFMESFCVENVLQKPEDLYANGTVIFNESNLIVLQVDKEHYLVKENSSREINKFDTKQLLQHFLYWE